MARRVGGFDEDEVASLRRDGAVVLGPIAAARLAARPATPTCIDCAV